MNDSSSSEAELLDRLRAGDPEAVSQFLERYGQRLTHLAEKQLSRRLAARMDGEDVVQSVFRTFFRRSSAGQFQIDTTAQLWQLLVKITILKARAKGRSHTASKRDVNAEVAGGDAWLPEAIAREPGPAEAAELLDQIDALLRGLPEIYCRVLEMRLQGRSVAEIAVELDVSRQTIYRAIHLLQNRLAESVADSHF